MNFRFNFFRKLFFGLSLSIIFFGQIFGAEKIQNRPRIGILTSGGDCAGLNAVIYSAYHLAKQKGYDLIGFKQGVHGLVNNDYVVLNDEDCSSDILDKAGSISKCNTKELRKGNILLSKSEAYNTIIEEYQKLGLSGVIYIGGDGSIGIMKHILKIADQKNLTNELQIVEVPKTIDNDIGNTDVALGFSTVCSVVSDAIKNLMSSIRTHGRVAVVEVMGRAAGYIALQSGLATGADVILIPEYNYDMEEVYKKIKKEYEPGGKGYSLIVVAEAVEFAGAKYESKQVSDALTRINYGGIGELISRDLKKRGLDAKSIQLGHIQRGGTTTVEDRTLGMNFGSHAVELIDKKSCGCQLGLHNGKIIETPLRSIEKTTRELTPSDDNIRLAKSLGIYIGTPKKNSYADDIRKTRRNRIFDNKSKKMRKRNLSRKNQLKLEKELRKFP